MLFLTEDWSKNLKNIETQLDDLQLTSHVSTQ